MAEHYLEGIASSLSPSSSLLVRKHYDFYRALEVGKKMPETKAQERFVLVCKGLASALSDHEKAYWEYIQKRDSYLEHIRKQDRLLQIKTSQRKQVSKKRPVRGTQAAKKKKEVKQERTQPVKEGYCRQCRKKIDPRRLELYPQSKLCVPCKSGVENTNSNKNKGKRKVSTDGISGSREANKKMRNWKLS